MAGKLKTEVRQLADAAMQAAAYEREYRANLVARGRRTLRTGLVIGAASATGILVISMFRRRGHDERDGRKREDSRGFFERASDNFMTLVRWGATASQLWTLAFAPQQAPVDTLPEA